MIIVQKYGGSSVSNTEKIRNVAKRAAIAAKDASVVVVVSAMGDTTDDLLSMAKELSAMPDGRELDKLLATGEQMSSALLTIALQSEGVRAVSLTGGQAGIITERVPSKARILKIDPGRVEEELNNGKVVVVAGFQGITENASWADITTLGRGGSDTTAVALAAALKADKCEIYTDVDGVYSADPRLEPNAVKLDSICYEEMLEMAVQGAKVMHSRAVELGELYDVEILVANSSNDSPGTIIKKEDTGMEIRNPVRGIAHDADTARLTVMSVPDRAGVAYKLFQSLADNSINVDIIVQNMSVTSGLTDISFTVALPDLEKAKRILSPLIEEMGAKELFTDQNVAKISIIGSGIRSHPGYAAKMFGALADEGINILGISTSEIRITCLINKDYVKQSVKALHNAFHLEKP
ncbi:MAG: aspartate kinase [Armatimonadota bacterium]